MAPSKGPSRPPSQSGWSMTSRARYLYGLIGAGGFGREVMPLLEACVEEQALLLPEADAEVAFVESTPSAQRIGARPVLALGDFLAADDRERLFNVAIADSYVRERLALACLAGGCLAQTLIAGDAEIFKTATIGEGAIICGRTMITDKARIGRFFHCNIYSYVAHDCVVGDFVTFGPRVSCNGNVRIDDHAYVGAGVVIRQGAPGRPLVIGEGAVIGMGAVVTRDVAPRTTVIGNPARPLAPSSLAPSSLDGPEAFSASG